jgi:hypothetical protein
MRIVVLLTLLELLVGLKAFSARIPALLVLVVDLVHHVVALGFLP